MTSAVRAYPTDLLDKYRYVNVSYDDWADYVVGRLKDRMSEIGISVREVCWSGFWSQGDGACFTGCVSDWGLYLAHLGHTDPKLVALARDEWSMEWYRSGYYYHSHSVRFSGYMPSVSNPYDKEDDSLRAAVWDALHAHLDEALFSAIEAQIERNLRGHMDTFYKELQEEYEYLTNDESITSFLDDNPELIN